MLQLLRAVETEGARRGKRELCRAGARHLGPATPHPRLPPSNLLAVPIQHRFARRVRAARAGARESSMCRAGEDTLRQWTEEPRSAELRRHTLNRVRLQRVGECGHQRHHVTFRSTAVGMP